MSAPKFINQTQYSLPYCKICSAKPTTSTIRDLVFFFVTTPLSRIRASVKSLYGTGYRGQSILVIDQSLAYTQEDIMYFSPFHSSFYVSSVSFKENSYMPLLSVNSILPFIKNNFDRVLYINSSSVFFQSDPFTTFINDNSLHIIFGNETYGSTSQKLSIPYLIGGPIDPFLKLFSQIDQTQQISPINFWNQIIWNQYYNMKFHSCGNEVVAVGYCSSDYIVNEWELYSKDHNEPTIFLNYNNSKEYYSYFEDICTS